MSAYKFTPAKPGDRIIIKIPDRSIHLALVVSVNENGQITQARTVDRLLDNDTLLLSISYLIYDVNLSDEEFLSLSFSSIQECYDKLRWLRDGVDENGYLPDDVQNPKRKKEFKPKQTKRTSVMSLDMGDI